MKSASKYLGLLVLVLLLVPFAYARDGDWHGERPDGASFRGHSFSAEFNTKILVSVLTDKDGPIPDRKFAAGQYQLQVKAVGYRTDPRRSDPGRLTRMLL